MNISLCFTRKPVRSISTLRVFRKRFSQLLLQSKLRKGDLTVKMASATETTESEITKALPYLSLTADDATNTPVDTKIEGQIPDWLEGSLYRNGSGIFTVGSDRMNHLFDGFAILHRFNIAKGKVTYISRVLDSDSWQRSFKANRLVATQFATYETPDPCKSMFSKLTSYFKPSHGGDWTDNTSVNIVEHGDRLYALTEAPWMVRVDPEKLNIVGKENLVKTIAVHLSTAHPHVDKEGNMYNLATAFNPPDNYNIVLIPPPQDSESPVTTKAKRLVALPSRWKMNISYNHSFGMSEEHFVILEQPVVMSSLKFLTNNWRKAAPFQNFSNYPKEDLLFRVVRRSDNKEVNIKYRAAPAFCFHFVNCFETEADDGAKFLVVDFVGYSDLSIVEQLSLNNLSQKHVDAIALFRRYVLPLSIEEATVGQNLVTLANSKATAVLKPDRSVYLDYDLIVEGGVQMELPRINYERYNAVDYRYVYGTILLSADRRLVKLDLEKKAVLTWTEKGYEPGEPVFVQRPGATEEDDGVVLSPMLGLQPGLPCFLVVLDAASFKEVARAVTPAHVKMALTFHGTYVSAS